MKQTFLVLALLLLMTLVNGQKFMIIGNDTLPYKEEIQIRNGDTSYLSACRTFEKVNGQIINQSDDYCLRQGLWILNDTLGNYWKGEYKNNNQIGTWKKFDRNGNLIKEARKVHLGSDSYLVKEIEYNNNVPTVLIDRKFLAFYIDYFWLLIIIIFGSFFGRVFINSGIYNNENGTDFSPIYFFAPGNVSNNFHHSLLCTFTLWFSNYKPENKQDVITSNVLSLISTGLFFGIIIGLAIAGEI
ncbi:MAG: hypothetical protein FD170_2042 [Bacteroidetes bacterium]|nr:MAG: hypothetical protein FD170_2042 [Bacteroidota bacterium]